MSRDPHTSAQPDETIVLKGQDTKSPKADDAATPGTAPPPVDSASDVTLPPPSRPQAPSDVTLPPPPRNVTDTLPAHGNVPTGDFHSEATLAPPPRTTTGGADNKVAQRTIVMAPTAPDDATLDPNDPQAKAYQAAVTKSSPSMGSASFGDYQLLEPIAKGGMGIVYKARQRKLNRIVAIKMILAGQFADQTDVDRFYAEAAAAGKLRHPNIVGIHEIGEVNGQHFFSMDYIEGDSLAGLVRENPLTPTKAAEYVKTIAETMQYAHEHDIVHRDLKPSNVLLDKIGRPLITDFGLAKQVSNKQSQLTMEGAIVGTPSYMPPEQAAGDGERVGTWSDLYSTGAILYELLTGRPPFRAASPFETVRQVLEMEPLSPRLVNPSVPKDLETICLKCLQKEPAKRYATCQELADELGRYLRNEPIKARPIGRVARLWRLCRRNPVPAVAIAASVLFLIIAAFGASVGLVQTRRALAVSEESFRKQLSVVNEMMTSVSENTLINQPGMQPLRKDLLERALAYYEGFAKERADDASLQDELASAHFRIGAITEMLESLEQAMPHYERAREMQERLLKAQPGNTARLEALGTTLNAIGTLQVRQRKFAAAQKTYALALDTREQLIGIEPQHSEYQRLLANTHMNIGLAYYNAGDNPRARQAIEQAQAIRKTALSKEQKHFKLRRDLGKGDYNLGTVLWFDGDIQGATKHFQSAIDNFGALIAEQPGDLENNKLHAICLRTLGDIYADSAPREAERYYTTAIERLQELTTKNPNILDYQVEYAGVLMNTGLMMNRQDSKASKHYEQAREILKSLVTQYPTNPRYQRDLATTLQALGIAKQAAGEYEVARTCLYDARDVCGSLLKQYKNEDEYQGMLAGVLIDLGQLELQHGDPVEAIVAFTSALSIRQTFADQEPADKWLQYDVATTLRRLGLAQRKAGDPAEALRTLKKARDMLARLSEQSPDVPEFKAELEAIELELKPLAET